MRRIGTLILVLGLVDAAAAGDGGLESPFSMGAGARDLALGGASFAQSDPFTSPFWNPSVLARADRLAVGAFHSSLFESDASYQYLGVAVPTMDMGGFGFGLFRLGIGGIEKRDNSNLLQGEIDDNRLGLCFGYGRSVSIYDVGVALTLEHHSIDTYKATSSPGLNISISRCFKPAVRWLSGIRAAATGRNLMRPRMKLAGDDIRYPSAFDAGLSLIIVPRRDWDHSLTLSSSMSKVDLIDLETAVGLEYTIDERVHLRAGMRDARFSFGAGISYRSIAFDYAMVDRGLGSLHMFNVSAGIGMPFSERRTNRERERDARFNDLINRRLADQSRVMVSALVSEGEQSIEAGDLARASIALDRALFIAAGSSMDTTSIYTLARDVKNHLERLQIEQAFEAHMDSARTKLDGEDFLGARYFAELALSGVPGSREARQLLERAEAAMQESDTLQRMVENRLLLADSLISYGRYDEALVIARTLKQAAGADSRTGLTVKKAEFGYWQDVAEAAFARADYQTAVSSVDSALARFPEHPRSLSLRGQIDRRLRKVEAAHVATREEPAEPLSEELLREVEQTYESGQRLFEQGHLEKAVSRWERVERLAPNYKSVREYLVNAYKFFGVELYTQNELEQAVEIWKKASALAPDNNEIVNYIQRTENEIAKLQELSYEY
jgi:tetratricopeptide (TPR) repeat protein